MTSIGGRWNRIRYTLYAPVYDLVTRRVARGRRRAHELAAIRPGERVLLDGAGTGLDLELIPAGADVSAIDITPADVSEFQAPFFLLFNLAVGGNFFSPAITSP